MDTRQRGIGHQPTASRHRVPAEKQPLLPGGQQQVYPAAQNQRGVHPPKITQVRAASAVRDLRLTLCRVRRFYTQTQKRCFFLLFPFFFFLKKSRIGRSHIGHILIRSSVFLFEMKSINVQDFVFECDTSVRVCFTVCV